MLDLHNDTPELAARDIVATMDNLTDGDKNQTLTRVVTRLTKDHKFGLEEARDAAAIAIADMDAKNLDARFDLGSSSETCLFLTIDGRRAAVSVAEIVEHFEFL